MSGIFRISARDVEVGDEILSGPQGPIDGAPTVLAVQTLHGVVNAALRDDGPRDSAVRWTPDSPLTVLRPERS